VANNTFKKGLTVGKKYNNWRELQAMTGRDSQLIIDEWRDKWYSMRQERDELEADRDMFREDWQAMIKQIEQLEHEVKRLRRTNAV
jgi:NDP-sugar pyrophosphorylase family protein